MGMLLGRVLRDVRLESGKRLKDIASEAEISAPYVSQIESGKREPQREVMDRLLDSYGIGRDELNRRLATAAFLYNVTVPELERLIKKGVVPLAEAALRVMDRRGPGTPQTVSAASHAGEDFRDDALALAVLLETLPRWSDSPGVVRSQLLAFGPYESQANAPLLAVLRCFIPAYVGEAIDPDGDGSPDLIATVAAFWRQLPERTARERSGDSPPPGVSFVPVPERSRERWRATGEPPDRFWIDFELVLGGRAPEPIPMVFEARLRQQISGFDLEFRLLPRLDTRAPTPPVLDYEGVLRLVPEGAGTGISYHGTWAYNERLIATIIRIAAERVHEGALSGFLAFVADRAGAEG